jgi:MGT family glycosyltransferase
MHVKSAFVLRAAAKGLANLPMQVIMTTGGNREPGEIDLLPIAGNIHIVRWVSHSELLPKTNVVVTTGGAGTVLAALHAGVPMVIVPTEWDKPEIAQRVVEAGAGIRLSPARCTPKRLRAAVERVLEEPSFKQNAQRLATIFSQYGGPDRAAELLEKLNINKGVVK